MGRSTLHAVAMAVVVGVLTVSEAVSTPLVANEAPGEASVEAPAAREVAPEPVVSYGPAVWMRITRIGVDNPIRDVGVGADGLYTVPWWDIGHHADSANPGERGNSVFNGHVLTIDAGNVFRRLKELEPGDQIVIETPAYRTEWVVQAAYAVPDGDHSFIQPTADTRLTIYTCTGTFDRATQNFSHRQVVVGQLAQVTPRT